MIPILSSLQFINIQSHADTLLSLAPGLNVIMGTSHMGKSAMVRGVKWWMFNEPLAPQDKIKNWFAKDSDEMAVIGEFSDGSYVIRTHSKSFNGYIVGDGEGNEEPYEALRGEVPEEVRKALQMDKVNFQGQGDGYFMFDSTSGEVARMFNESAGLNIITIVNHNMNVISRKTEDDLRTNKASLKKEKDAADKLSFVRTLDSKIKLLSRKVNRHENLSSSISSLESTVNRIEKLEETIRVAKIKTSYKSRILLLKTKVLEYKQIDQKYTSTNSLFNSIMERQRTIRDDKEWLKVKDKARALRIKISELAEKTENFDKVNTTYNSILRLDKSCSTLSLHIKTLKERRQQLQLQLDYCPKCGAHKKYWEKEE